MLSSNWVAFFITLLLAVAWLRMVDFAAQKKWISSRLSRKIIHIGTGPIFVLCWLLFNDQPMARFFAALIPLAITLQFFLIGVGVIKDDASVAAMSRTGDRREILRGPLIYGIVFVLITVLYWKNPIGIIALMVLCGGDGLADVIGMRFASKPIPWSPRKTIAGSTAMFLGGMLLSLFVIGMFSIAGVLHAKFGLFVLGIAVIAFVASIVESLPIADFDNVTVPATAILLGHILFGTLI